MKKLLSTIATTLILGLFAINAISQTCDLVSSTPDDGVSPDIWTRPFADGTCCTGLGPMSYHIYGPFAVSTTGNYDIASVQAGWDGYIFIYETSFDPNNQTVNFVAGDDDGIGGIGTSNIDALPLTAGTHYYLITTGFSNGDFGSFTNSITGPGSVACPAAAVPTMGEWGLIILALLTLSFGTVFMMRSRMAVAGAGNVSVSSGIPFNRAAYGKLLAVVMAGLAASFAVAVFAFGYEMTAADVPGSLIAGPIFAYLLHLLAPAKKEQ